MPSHRGSDWLGMFEHQKEKSVGLGWNECISMLLLSNKLPETWCLNTCLLPHSFCRTEVPQSSAGFLVTGPQTQDVSSWAPI